MEVLSFVAIVLDLIVCETSFIKVFFKTLEKIGGIALIKYCN